MTRREESWKTKKTYGKQNISAPAWNNTKLYGKLNFFWKLLEKRLEGKTEQVLNMLQGKTEKECYKVAQGKTEQALQGGTGNWQTNTDRLWNTGKW